MEDSVNNSGCNVVEEILKHIDGEADSAANIVEVTSLLTSLICMVLAMIVNAYIIVNILHKRKFKVCYFIIFIFLLIIQTIYLCLVSLRSVIAIVPQCLPPSLPLGQVTPLAGILARTCLGIFAAIVGALTIERFISSTSSSTLVRCCTSLLAMVAAVSAPVVLVAFFLITSNHEGDNLHQEFWFGAEVCVYIIVPLLTLTIFGTVNCCKVSMTSRLLPYNQIQAIKLNIGVSILTNISIFVFLVQESLHLWQSQIEVRNFEETDLVQDEYQAAIMYLSMGHNLCSIILSFMVTLVSFIYCIICSTCCYSCCCPAINQLEQARYIQVEKEIR